MINLSDKKIIFHLIFALIGFTAIVSQIIFIREFIVVFHGNEISLGIFLSSWLFWTACGSFLFGRFIGRLRNPNIVLPVLQIIIAIIIPLTILMIRFSKKIFQDTPGEILGLFSIFMDSFLILSIFCLLSGGLFSGGAFLYAQVKKKNLSSASGFVYLFEALGSGIGGLLISFLLIPYFNVFDICLMIALMNIFCACYLLLLIKKSVIRILFFIVSILILFILRSLDTLSYKALWNNLPVLTHQNTIMISTDFTKKPTPIVTVA